MASNRRKSRSRIPPANLKDVFVLRTYNIDGEVVQTYLLNPGGKEDIWQLMDMSQEFKLE
jgi:hypothetical protein